MLLVRRLWVYLRFYNNLLCFDMGKKIQFIMENIVIIFCNKIDVSGFCYFDNVVFVGEKLRGQVWNIIFIVIYIRCIVDFKIR